MNRLIITLFMALMTSMPVFADPLLVCPCWDTFTEAELVALMEAGPHPTPTCDNYPLNEFAQVSGGAVAGSAEYPYALAMNDIYFFPLKWECRFTGADNVYLALPDLDPGVAAGCVAELGSAVPQIDWCP